jgi:hypothetical protein
MTIEQITIEHLALATAGCVIFLILILLSRKQRFFDKRLRRMQSEVNDLRIAESRRFSLSLNAGKSLLAPPGNEPATSLVAGVASPAIDEIEGPEVIPLVPGAARR